MSLSPTASPLYGTWQIRQHTDCRILILFHRISSSFRTFCVPRLALTSSLSPCRTKVPVCITSACQIMRAPSWSGFLKLETFEVSSVLLQTNKHPYGQQMSPREFWNLARRAGQISHDSVGVVGLAEGSNCDAHIEFVSRSTGVLVSRLVSMLNEIAEQGQLANSSEVLWEDGWEYFRCYVAHLWAEKKTSTLFCRTPSSSCGRPLAMLRCEMTLRRWQRRMRLRRESGRYA